MPPIIHARALNHPRRERRNLSVTKRRRYNLERHRFDTYVRIHVTPPLFHQFNSSITINNLPQRPGRDPSTMATHPSVLNVSKHFLVCELYKPASSPLATRAPLVAFIPPRSSKLKRSKTSRSGKSPTNLDEMK